jgi:hypothetical protein
VIHWLRRIYLLHLVKGIIDNYMQVAHISCMVYFLAAVNINLYVYFRSPSWSVFLHLCRAFVEGQPFNA